MAASQESPEARMVRLRAVRKAATEAAWEHAEERHVGILIKEEWGTRIDPNNTHIVVGHKTILNYEHILMGSAPSLEKAVELAGEIVQEDIDLTIRNRDGKKLMTIEKPPAGQARTSIG